MLGLANAAPWIVVGAIFGGGLVGWVQQTRLNAASADARALAASHDATEKLRQADAARQIAENAERERLQGDVYRAINADLQKQLDDIAGRVAVERLRPYTTTVVYRDRGPDAATAAGVVRRADRAARLVPDPRASAILADAGQDETDAARADQLAARLRACVANAQTDRMR